MSGRCCDGGARFEGPAAAAMGALGHLAVVGPAGLVAFAAATAMLCFAPARRILRRALGGLERDRLPAA